MKNWYAVTITGHVDRFGVEITKTVGIQSSCAWTKETLEPVIAELAKNDEGISGTRVIEFESVESPEYSSYDKLVNLDRTLGI